MKFFGRVKNKEDIDEERRDDRVALVEESPYYISPSFFTHGGKIAAILQLYIRAGSNRHMSFTDVIDLIPVSAMTDVDLYMFCNEKLITGDEKKRLIRTNASGGKRHVEDIEETGSREDADNASARRVNESQKEDFDDYDLIIDSSDVVAAYKIQLLVEGKSQEAVDEQIEMLNVSLAQKHDGAMWDSIGGDQSGRLKHLLDTYRPSEFDMTSTGDNYSRMNFSVSSGLDDPNGIYTGVDAVSLTHSNSSVDFDSFLKKMAIIATPSGSTMLSYVQDRNEVHSPSLSSQLSQTAANQVWMNGHRVHHFVLGDFDYLADSRYQALSDRHLLFKKYNVDQVTINPMQGFGDVANIQNIYNRLVQKIVNIFDVLNNMSLTKEDRGVIYDAVQRFYSNSDLWGPSMADNPKRSRLVGSRSDTFPTMVGLINSFSESENKADHKGRAEQGMKISALSSILSQNIHSNTKILGRHTSIESTDAGQVYYDFSRIEDSRIIQVQFLNLIDYVFSTAQRGDLVVIHGAEKLYAPVMSYAQDSILSAQRQGVRFIFSFDTVSAQKSSKSEMSDMFKMKGTYYHNLDADIDYTIVGRCNSHEIEQFQDALDFDLSDSIRSHMRDNAVNNVLFHRQAGRVNNFIRAESYI